ncbi:MAG: undecaprenyl/decaprenyl-phosphate alpha-N-acetylglucosaminyl 1-phosphate transferase [Actinomycetota bacterium]|nr:undecaprenyl/decaprenyl-phosphate alpha-N-acetylglucosaminyl 1-phosphate transferase [Actinomycetota bacterium]
MVAPLILLVALLVGAAAIRLGPVLGLVDHPDGGLKPHQRAVVPLGGIAVFVAVHLGMAAFDRFDRGLFAASLLALLLGLVDDRRGLTPTVRLLAEVAIGAVLVLTADAAGLGQGAVTTVVALLLVVVTINAVNLLDGIDGLVGSVATVSALGLAVLGAVHGVDLGFGILLAAALLGFLVWNWPPASLFLGDNGAYTVAVFLVYGIADVARPGSAWSLLAVSGVLGIIVVDLVVTLLRRRAAGSALFAGDRSHLYDQLHQGGMAVWMVTTVLTVAQVMLVTVVILLDAALDDGATVVALAAVLVATVLALRRLGFVGTR